jgi:tripartite-type tricarboxylate transporter receptor subunit TctC
MRPRCVSAIRFGTTVLLVAVGLVPCAAAQDYPAPGRTVRLVIPFPPGGNVDLGGRIVAQKMSEGFGRQVLPENRTGAGGIIANEHVARSAPDGYTLLVVSGAHVTQAAVMRKLPYDPVRDFAWISTAVSYPLVLAVRTESRFKSLDEYIAHVKARPGANYPSPGMGTLYHLAAEMFISMAGIEMTHVPFRGGGEPLTEVLSGRMDLLFDAITNASPHIQAGKFRALAVSSLAPSPSLPGVPTVAASVPGYEASSFLGIAAAAETPPAVVERLNREVRRILELPEIRSRFAEWGGQAMPGSPEEMRRHVETEIAKWKRVVEARKIEIQ